MSHFRGRASGVAVAAGAVGALLAGCGSSGGHTPSAPATVASTATTPATTAATTPAAGGGTTASATVTAPAGGGGAGGGGGTAISRCHTSQLTLRPGEGDAGAGNRYQPFGLRNASSTTCTITGYVGAALYGPNGAALPSKLTRDRGVISRVTLKPGGAAFFYFHWVAAGNLTPPCTPENVAKVAVTPPDETTQLYAQVRLDPCRGEIDTAPVSATAT